MYYIFLDVDGTLVNYENELPESAVTAIKAAQANGHKVVIVTGRSKAEMYDYILNIGFDGYIGGNGNYVEFNDQPLYHETLSQDTVRSIIDWLDERGLEYYLEANSGLYGSENFKERGKPTMQAYSAYKGQSDAAERTVEDAFPNMIYDADPCRDDINKISFILEGYQDYLDAKDKFSEYLVGTWGGVGEQALFGDIALAGITKQTGIDHLLEELDETQAKTIAFGDAKIDIPMIKGCDVGVAMGNGGDTIKEAADYITDSVEDDGLYNAFKHFGLIE